MDENMPSIVEHLMITLQKTSYLDDLAYLDYRKNDEEGTEVVVAGFRNGRTKTINVHLDSGIAMIQDVIRGLTTDGGYDNESE